MLLEGVEIMARKGTNERGFNWKEKHYGLRRDAGQTGHSIGSNATDELSKSMGWDDDDVVESEDGSGDTS